MTGVTATTAPGCVNPLQVPTPPKGQNQNPHKIKKDKMFNPEFLVHLTNYRYLANE